MSKNEEVCPEFPFWGASYPDACCVNGVLQDLDYCDEMVIFMIKENMFLVHFVRQKNLLSMTRFQKKMNFMRILRMKIKLKKKLVNGILIGLRE